MIGRPHHHACIFNFDFPDKEPWQTKGGIILYRSKILEKLWSDPVTGESYGFTSVGEVTFESAAYVARYILKKFTNKDKTKVDAHYMGKQPEFTTMSRAEGIGKRWFQKFKKDVYPNDYVLNKKLAKLKPPRYYDNIFKIESPEEMERIKAKRIRRQKEKGLTNDQIKVKEEILERNTKKLIREIEQ